MLLLLLDGRPLHLASSLQLRRVVGTRGDETHVRRGLSDRYVVAVLDTQRRGEGRLHDIIAAYTGVMRIGAIA